MSDKHDKRHTQIIARFAPRNLETLRPEAQYLIGIEAEWTYAWLMKEGEQFPGVWAMTTFDRRFPFWVPEFDLEPVE